MIHCIRCHKPIKGDVTRNADYVIAPEFIAVEAVPALFAVTRVKVKDKDDKEFDIENSVEITGDTDVSKIENVHHLEARVKTVDQQRTGIVCNECYNPATDRVIWGAHKGVN